MPRCLNLCQCRPKLLEKLPRHVAALGLPRPHRSALAHSRIPFLCETPVECLDGCAATMTGIEQAASSNAASAPTPRCRRARDPSAGPAGWRSVPGAGRHRRRYGARAAARPARGRWRTCAASVSSTPRSGPSYRRMERPLPPLRLDQDRRRDPQESRPKEDFSDGPLAPASRPDQATPGGIAKCSARERRPPPPSAIYPPTPHPITRARDGPTPRGRDVANVAGSPLVLRELSVPPAGAVRTRGPSKLRRRRAPDLRASQISLPALSRTAEHRRKDPQ